MPQSAVSRLNKFLITVFLLNFLFVSCSSYVEPPNAQPPSSSHLPKLCNFDYVNYFIYGPTMFDNIESCNIGLLRRCNVKQIYQFGDSVSDVGNSVREGATTPFASLPYGSNFPEGSTGRASNGKLMIDYFAMDAGLPLLPAYRNRDADFSDGINFAVAGSTALAWDELATLNISSKTNSSLSVQLNWMSTYLYSLCNYDIECGEKFQDALFMLGPFGGSDYYEAIFQGKSIQEITSKLVPKVVDAIMAGVRRLIDFGAKRVMVPGLYSIHRLPLFQTSLAMNPEMQRLIEDHNSALRSGINKLMEEERPNAIVAFGDYSSAYASLKAYAATVGHMHTMAGESGGSVCAEPDRCISWDGLHLTQEAYRIMSKFLLYNFFLDLHCPY